MDQSSKQNKQALRMTYREVAERFSEFDPAIVVSRTWPRPWRGYIIGGLILAATTSVAAPLLYPELLNTEATYALRAGFLLSLALAAHIIGRQLMYASYAYSPAVSYDLAKVVYDTPRRGSLLEAFAASWIGREIFERSGLDQRDIDSIVTSSAELDLSKLEFEVAGTDIKAGEFARGLFRWSPTLSQALLSAGATEDVFARAADWAATRRRDERERKRWWGSERLRRITPIGRGWSYGHTYELYKYGRTVDQESMFSSIRERLYVHADDIRRIERVLLKADGANVMVIGADSLSALEATVAFGRSIADGIGAPELEHHLLYLVDGGRVVEGTKEKTAFEATIRKMLAEADRAGNIIVAFTNFPELVESAHAIGADLVGLLTEVLASTRVNVIALCDERGFHGSVEPNHTLMRHFEKVPASEASADTLYALIERATRPIERAYRMRFTVGAVAAIIESAQRSYGSKPLNDAAFDILNEVVPDLVHRGVKTVSASDVSKVASEATGVPQGAMGDDERAKLANLESILRERVVGQEEALKAVSSGLRKSRAGLSSAQRPMGSFLFIGPTGVGKTETAKALADAFFDGEDAIIRLDMSEYSTGDSVDKLIGSFTTGSQGILASKLRERPYGVLLLDEFEKTDQRAMDVFLRILDEGVFTDGSGETVNARNLIMIATSNAGSDLVYEAIDSGTPLNKDTVVNAILERNILRPELVNRFDAVILFKPLADEQLSSVARLLLDKVVARMKAKGIQVVITDALVTALVQRAKNRAFGAREMRRVVSDNVEDAIARSLIAGTARPGSKLEILPPDAALGTGDEFSVKIG